MDGSRDRIKIIGGIPIEGRIKISGAKNSALPLVIVSILTNQKLVLQRVPNLLDMQTAFNILRELGVSVNYENETAILQANNINNFTASYDLVSSMRASVLILGPLLARFHKALVPLPGGCSIGLRPVDLHIKALEKMGATISIEHGNIVASAKGGLRGAEIIFDKISVGATENILMAATLAKGITTIVNAAREPEIVDLAKCLVKMGAKIEGVGSAVIKITGVNSLSGAEHTVVTDRIQAGSYAIAAAATAGHVFLEEVESNIFGEFLDVLRKTGVVVNELENNTIEVISNGVIHPVDITTAPYPYFPTDLQSPFSALMTIARGKSVINERIFENRFTHVPELIRMGASINITDHSTVVIDGVNKLYSAEVKATDLRSSFSLIIAALVAEGETTISELHHLDRGYVNVINNLLQLGAKIKRGVNI